MTESPKPTAPRYDNHPMKRLVVACGRVYARAARAAAETILDHKEDIFPPLAAAAEGVAAVEAEFRQFEGIVDGAIKGLKPWFESIAPFTYDAEEEAEVDTEAELFAVPEATGLTVNFDTIHDAFQRYSDLMPHVDTGRVEYYHPDDMPIFLVDGKPHVLPQGMVEEDAILLWLVELLPADSPKPK